jgi:hypothetical protein
MRKGYWKTLLRRLRGRVASGLDTFAFHGTALALTEVLASDDQLPDSPCELPLAATAGGALLLIDTGNNIVILRAKGAEHGQSTGLDLPAFIDALTAGIVQSASPELSLGDAELLDLPLPVRGLSLGD